MIWISPAGRNRVCGARDGIDLVAQDEIGAGIAGAGGGELVAQGGEGLGAPGRGERVEPDGSSPLPGWMSPVSASRISA